MMPVGRAERGRMSGTHVQFCMSVEYATPTVWFSWKPQAPTFKEAHPLDCSRQAPYEAPYHQNVSLIRSVVPSWISMICRVTASSRGLTFEITDEPPSTIEISKDAIEMNMGTLMPASNDDNWAQSTEAQVSSLLCSPQARDFKRVSTEK